MAQAREERRVVQQGAFERLEVAPAHRVDESLEKERERVARRHRHRAVVVPCRTAILDLEAITDTVQFLATTGTPALVVLNAVSPHGRDAAQAADALHTLTLDVCSVRVGHRVAFARALLTGQAAQEYDPGSKAAAEIEHLHAFLMKRVHNLTPSQSGVLAND